jgi:putative FmdB family regulatory protein
MPTYEYECKTCGHDFEVFQSMSDSPLKECPECGKEIRRRIFGGTGVIFRGTGFYVTDKSGSSAKTGEKTKTAESATETAKGDSAPKQGSAAGEPSKTAAPDTKTA